MRVQINRYLIEVYKPWGGAKAVWGRMTDEELEKIENWLDDGMDYETMDETQINNFFWSDDKTWLEIIGETKENFYNREITRESI